MRNLLALNVLWVHELASLTIHLAAQHSSLDNVLSSQDQALRKSSTHALLQEKIRQLEIESCEPERRELAKARKKQLKEVSAVLADKAKSPEDKINFLQQKIISLV